MSTGAVDSFDARSLWESIGGDYEYFEEMVLMLVAARPALVDNVRTALAAGDEQAALRVVKALKNSLRALHADNASELAGVLELQIRAGATQTAQRSLHELERVMDSVERTFSQILAAFEDCDFEKIPPQPPQAYLV